MVMSACFSLRRRRWKGPALLIITSLCLSAQAQDTGSVDNEVCLECHETYDEGLAQTAHRLSVGDDKSADAVLCVSCHAGGAEHIEDPSTENIVNPPRQFSAATEDLCTQCHSAHEQTRTAGFDPHLDQDIACTDCHGIHGGYEALLVDEEAGFCGNCHVGVVNQFRRRSNHPLTDQAVTCLSCHNVAGDNNVDFGHGADANCYQCHMEHSGPYLYEHDASSSFSTDGGGCISCHQPHGSANDRLLNQPGGSLCIQCHGLPPMHRARHGGIGAKFDCIECHSQVHGSYDNQALLDLQMDVKISGQPNGCYCHFVR